MDHPSLERLALSVSKDSRLFNYLIYVNNYDYCVCLLVTWTIPLHVSQAGPAWYCEWLYSLTWGCFLLLILTNYWCLNSKSKVLCVWCCRLGLEGHANSTNTWHAQTRRWTMGNKWHRTQIILWRTTFPSGKFPNGAASCSHGKSRFLLIGPYLVWSCSFKKTPDKGNNSNNNKIDTNTLLQLASSIVKRTKRVSKRRII